MTTGTPTSVGVSLYYREMFIESGVDMFQYHIIARRHRGRGETVPLFRDGNANFFLHHNITTNSTFPVHITNLKYHFLYRRILGWFNKIKISLLFWVIYYLPFEVLVFHRCAESSGRYHPFPYRVIFLLVLF